MRRRRGRASSGDAGRVWPRWLAAGLALATLCFGAGYLLAVQVLFPPAVEAAPGIAVPQLVGLRADRARETLRERGLVLADTLAMVHPREPAGTVIAQSPVAGMQLRRGGAVRLALSAGRARVRVPNVIGLDAADASQIAARLGFSVDLRETESLRPAGEVLRTAPDPGTELEVPARLTFLVSTGPPALPDTLVVPDTVPFLDDGPP